MDSLRAARVTEGAAPRTPLPALPTNQCCLLSAARFHLAERAACTLDSMPPHPHPHPHPPPTHPHTLPHPHTPHPPTHTHTWAGYGLDKRSVKGRCVRCAAAHCYSCSTEYTLCEQCAEGYALEFDQCVPNKASAGECLLRPPAPCAACRAAPPQPALCGQQICNQQIMRSRGPEPLTGVVGMTPEPLAGAAWPSRKPAACSRRCTCLSAGPFPHPQV